MRDWRQIDGFLNEQSAAVAEKLAGEVADAGWIIEIGCFKGKQSALIAASKKNSVLLSCVDPFPDTHIAFDDSLTYRDYTFGDWLTNLHGYLNVEPVRGFSPFNISYIQFSRRADLVVLNMDRVYDSLKFWTPHLSSQGKFLVHTYNYEHDRIITQVEKFLDEGEFICEMVGASAVLSRKI